MSASRVAVAAIAAFLVASCGSAPQPPTPSIMAAAAASLAPTAAAATTSPTGTPGATARPRPTPRPSPSPAPLAVPPAPTGATFKITYPSATKNTMTVTWKGPHTKGTEIRVYGVTVCIGMPASPAEGALGPCLVEHTPLPATVRRLIAKAPASTGKVAWTWRSWDDIGGSVAASPDGTTYEAIVVAAYNAAGHSKFIIVNPGQWCGYCTY